MSKKGRKRKRGDRQFGVGSMLLKGDGWQVLLPSTPPSGETLDEMTRTYQQNIRESALWDELATEFGEEEAERMLKRFRVEIR